MSNYWKKKLEELDLNREADIPTSRSYWDSKLTELENEEAKRKSLIEQKKKQKEETEKKLQSMMGYDPNEEEKERTWFQGGAFSDGYQFGDITKTTTATTEDLRGDLISGVLGIGEGVIDFGATLVGGVGKLFGADKFAEDTKEFVRKEIIDEDKIAKKILGVTNPFGKLHYGGEDELESSSLLGDKTDSLAQSAGQLAATAGIANFAQIPWWVTTGTTSFGRESEEAFKQGADYGEAMISAAISAGVEIGTEKLFGGSGLGEGGAVATELLTKGISNKAAKVLLDFGIDAVGESFEEVVAEFGSTLGRQLTYEREETLEELFTNEEAMDKYLHQLADSLFGEEAREAYGEAAMGGFILGGSANVGKVGSSIKNKTDYHTGLNANEEAVVNREVEKRIAEAEKKNGKKLSSQAKSDIYDEVMKDLDKGYISRDTIEEVLGGETYKSYQETVKNEDSLVEQEKALRDEYEELGKKTNPSLAEQSRFGKLETQLEELKTKIEDAKKTSERDFLQRKYKAEAEEIAKGSRLAETYREGARRGQKFEADVSKYKGVAKKSIESIIEKGQMNNSNRAHDLIDLAVNLAAARGKTVTTTTTEEILKKAEAKYGKQYVLDNFYKEVTDENGKKKLVLKAIPNAELDGDTIALNVDSPNLTMTIIGHELGHTFEGTKYYNEVADLLNSYDKTVKGNEAYETRKAATEGRYQNIAGANAQYELNNDLLGEYVFSDEGFVKHLTQNRNVFQRIYDQIKYMVKYATAGSQQKKDLLRIQQTFEKAWREAEKEQKNAAKKGGEGYSLYEFADGQRFVGVEADQAQFDGLSVKEQTDLATKIIKQKYQGKVIGIDNRAFVNGVTADEYTHPAKHIDSDIYQAKMRASTELDNLMDAGFNFRKGDDGQDGHTHPDLTDGFDYFDVIFKVGTEYYKGVINIKNVSKGKLLKDITKIENITEDMTSRYGESPSYAFLRDVSMDSVPQKGKNVNSNFSLSEAQEEYFKDSVVRDENGNLKVMYHGTSDGGFTVFDTYGSNYGLFGQGSYFTDSKSIADSYTKKGKGKTPQVYESYLNITNPIDMDAEANPAEWQEAFPEASFPESGTNEDFYRAMEEYFEDNEYSRGEAAEIAMDALESMGYDGITHIGGGRVNANGERHQVYIAFHPEQVKDIDNQKPTGDPDVRYSLSESNQEADTYSRIYDMQVEVNKLTQSIHEFENTAEFKTAMDALGEAINSGDIENGVKAYQKWRVDSGYDEMVSRRDSLRVELENLRKEFNEGIANKAVEQEKAAIAKSGLSEAEYFRKQAVKEFGYTPFFYDAGYITPNGKMLNFSGEKGKHYGTRGQDHRAIGTIYAESEGTDALNRFVRDGNIRIMAESPGLDVSTIAEPTKEQYATIRKFVSEYAGKEYFSVDFTDESGKVIGSLTYENRINPTRIVNDIKHYYETGEIRQPSDLERFRYSLSDADAEFAPVGNNVPMRDLRLETLPENGYVPSVEAPMQEDIAPIVTEDEMFPDDYAPMSEDEGATEERLASLDESVMPPESDPYYGEEEASAPADPFEDRDIGEVGNRKVKAYMYENPEVKPFFQEEANIMLGELNDTVKGERIYTETDLGGVWTGTSRYTSDDIAYLRDSLGYTYAEIERGLNAIIEDNGAENNAISKRIEFILNDRLAKGYTDFRTGMGIPANQEYIGLLNEKQITDYSREAWDGFIAEADQYAPPVEEDIGPVMESAPVAEATEDIAPVAEEYEAITPKKNTPKKKSKNKLVRAANVTPEQAKIAEILDAEPGTTSRKSRAWAKFRANFLDKGAVFEDLALKTKNRELMGKWNYMLYAEARAQRLMGSGAEGVKSLNSIIEAVGKTGKTKQFYEYLYHQHNADRMTLAERFEDIPNKAVFGDSVTADVSREAVAEMEKANPEFKQLAQDVYDYNNYLRSLLVENGVISQETADLWSEMYPHYVPIRRAGDKGLAVNVPLDTGRTGVNAPVKKATGGNSDILPLFDTMAMRTAQTFKAISKNSFGVELKNALGTTIESEATDVDDVIDSIDQQDGLLKKGENGKNPTFTVFENGEKVTYEITEDMYDALRPTSEGLAYTNTALNTVSNIHRGVLTEYNPVFMLTNAIKDIQDVFINSQHAMRTYAKVPEAYAQLAKKGYWYQEYMANGGEQNSYFDNETHTFKTENKGLSRLLDLPPLSTISKINNFIEMAPRLAEYIASREAGRSVEVSMLDAARVTTNFRAGGDITKFLNRNGATFLNASVQGAMQQVRNVREAKANGLKGWANLATKFALAGLPALLLNGLIWEDDEEYEELSDYVKQNYYIVGKYGDGKFIRIPKGRALAVIQDAFEQVSNALTGDDEVDLKAFLELTVSNLAPNNPIENNILSPIIQVANNETWYGEDLVPTRLQDLPAEEQFDESTDSFSKWLGEKLNISPYKINYLLDQYTGGVGDTILPMFTPEAESGDNSLLGNFLAPLKSKFTTDSTMNNQNVSDFYDKMDELTTNAKASAATDEDVLMSKYMNAVNSDLSELYALKRSFQNNIIPEGDAYEALRQQYGGKTIPDDVKYELVRGIQEQIVDMTRNGLNTYDQVDIKGDYATVGDVYFKRNDDGEWVKMSGAEVAKYKATSAAGNSSYATDGTNHYRWYVKEGETEGEWRKITDKELEKQNKVTSGLGISASDYWGNKDEYDYAYENPERYTVAKAVGGYDAWKTYSSDLYDIKADKDADGKTISGSRKEKVLDYVNGLNADYGEKIILFKSEYPSDDTYNYDIIDYLNAREDISYEEMNTILKELGFTIEEDGVTITW